MRTRLFATLVALSLSVAAFAQPLTTAFTYQGRLDSNGSPASGVFDMRFALFDAATAGNQLGPTLCVDNLNVSNGTFTTQLDFGPQFAGSQRFLEVAVRQDTGLSCASGSFTTLSPRQNLSAAPNAAYALTAGNAASAATATNATQLNNQPAAFYLNASNLGSGTIPDARLSTNVGTLNSPQTISAAKTFSAAPAFTAAGAPFTVTSSTLVNGLNADLLDGLSSADFVQTAGPQTVAGSKTFIGPTYLNGFVGFGTTSAIGSANFVLSQTTTSFGGMYINTSSATGLPFYGYAQNNGIAAYHYIDGGDGNKWKLVNGSTTALTVSPAGEFGVGTGLFTVANTPCKVAVAIPATKTFAIFGGAPSGNAPGAGPSQVPALWVDTGTVDRAAEFTSTTLGADATALLAQSNGGNAAITAFGLNSTLAAYLGGNVIVSGNLAKSGGSFRIDHPLDPANKYLSHSFVESPDMKNIYDGVVTTDERGYATVTLPDWFDALNRDFRYQLTVIDESDTDEAFIWAKIVRKIHDRQFTIRTSRPNVEVSWQVTGIRQDAWANAHRIPVEEDKPAHERGLFLHAKELGQPEDRDISRFYRGLAASPPVAK